MWCWNIRNDKKRSVRLDFQSAGAWCTALRHMASLKSFPPKFKFSCMEDISSAPFTGLAPVPVLVGWPVKKQSQHGTLVVLTQCLTEGFPAFTQVLLTCTEQRTKKGWQKESAAPHLRWQWISTRWALMKVSQREKAVFSVPIPKNMECCRLTKTSRPSQWEKHSNEARTGMALGTPADTHISPSSLRIGGDTQYHLTVFLESFSPAVQPIGLYCL